MRTKESGSTLERLKSCVNSRLGIANMPNALETRSSWTVAVAWLTISIKKRTG